MVDKKHKKVEVKQKKQKELFVEQLKKTPIVQIVCERLDIGRSTFYRWRRNDKKFSAECDKALEEGCALINDLAESTLISGMKNGNITACMYWLNHRHSAYKNKLEVSGGLEIKKDELTKEQETDIIRALELAELVQNINNMKGKNHEKHKNRQQKTNQENHQEAVNKS